MIIPVAAVATFLLVFWWPADGDLSRLAARFGPGALVEMAREVNSGPECIGPSFHDGICPDNQYSPAQLVTKRSGAASQATGKPTSPEQKSVASGLAMPLFLVLLIALAIASPKLMRRIVGVVDAKASTIESEKWMRPSREPPATINMMPRPEPSPETRVGPAAGFGRKRI
jgi:heat shock protein HtpX